MRRTAHSRAAHKRSDRAELARIYADAILHDPLGDPRAVEIAPHPVRHLHDGCPDRPSIKPPVSLPIRLRWIVLVTLILVGAVIVWA